jgi:tetratricopeptide (TPR) repeat protein
VPGLADRIHADARAALPGAAPADAAELLGMLAAVAPPEAAPDLHRAAAATLAAALSGEPDRDRAHLGPLSRHWERAGEPAAAAAALQRGLDAWPEDATFHEQRAGLALRTGDLDTAVQEGEIAVRLARGDHQLRAGGLLARALHAAGRTPEAAALVDRLLRETRAPDPAVAVRTHRHLDALRALQRELGTP